MREYLEVIRKIESLGIMPDRAPSLEPTLEGLKRLELNIDPDRVIVIAGTNGKGSICATLEALLLDAGKTTGLYTSPHLIETTERIRLNGVDISQPEFVAAYQEVEHRTGGLNLTHFEVLTLMSAWAFFSPSRPNPIDYAIFEVGLGGLWDATNAVPHSWNAIASLGFDHEKFLGSTIQSIARNKFGIIRPGSRVVHSPFPPGLEEEIKRVTCNTNCFWQSAVSFESGVEVLEGEPQFWVQTQWGKSPIRLPGNRGAQNTATALTLFSELGFDPAPHLKALSKVRWPGRMQRLHTRKARCPIYLSGDHNPQGVASLLDLLRAYPRKVLRIVTGIGVEKDLDGILGPLFEVPNSELYLTVPGFRGRNSGQYGNWQERAFGFWSDPMEALQNVIARSGPDDMILVTGSLYLVGDILRSFRD